MVDNRDFNPFNSHIVLNGWKKKEKKVEINMLAGAKISNVVIKDIGTYEITVIDEELDQIFVIYKSNIAYITKLKK